MTLYTTDDCTGTVAASGSAADFSDPGISVSVADDSSTTFYATATDAAGNTSACSVDSITYVEDSSAPAAPTITDTDPDSPANDNNPEVKGTADAGTTVKLYKTSDCTGAPEATGSAASFASPGLTASVANNSTTNFKATATDAVGNTSACSAAFTYVEDSSAPAAPTITDTDPDSPANDNNPEVKGTAESGSTVKLYTTSDCTGTAVSGSASSFATPGLTVTVTDNTSTNLKATATDAAGNTSACSGAFTYTEKSNPPETSITSGPAAGSRTNDSTPTFGFTSDEPSGDTFQCKLDAAAFGPCSGPGQTHTTAALADGTHTFRVRAIDEAGNVDPTPSVRSFTVDTDPPETSITSGPAAGSKIKDSTPTFGFTSDEPSGDTFQCKLDGAAFGPCSGPGQTHTTAALADGTHTFRVRATDAAGNVDATPSVVTFTVDTDPPETSITSGPAAASKIKDSTPTFGFTSDEPTGDTFQCKLDGAAFGPCSGPGQTHTTAALADGTHTFRVKAIDAAGNVDPTPSVVTFTVDTDPPETSITSGPAAGGTTADSTPTFGFTSDEPTGDTFQCKLDGAAFGPCSGPGQTHTTAPLANGTHTFRVKAIDAAGNVDPTPSVRTFTVTAP